MIVLFSAFALMFIFLLMIVLLAVLLSKLTLATLAVLSVIVGMFLIGATILVLIIINVLISRVVVAIWLGQWILRRIRPQLADNRFVPMLLGLAIIVLLLAIPYAGPVIGFLITLAGLGAITLWGLQRHDERLTASTKAEMARQGVNGVEAMSFSKRARLERLLAGEKADRPGVALWRHWPGDDQDAEELARSTLDWQKTFDFDFVKVSPDSNFAVEAWGARSEWQGGNEGNRQYIAHPIAAAADWARIQPLDPTAGRLGVQVECLEILGRALADSPFIQTIFSPTAQLKYLAGKARVLAEIRTHPDAVERALHAITETTVRFLETIQPTGVAGIFFATQLATANDLSLSEYERFRASLRHADHGRGQRIVLAEPGAYARPGRVFRPARRLSGPGDQLARPRERPDACRGAQPF